MLFYMTIHFLETLPHQLASSVESCAVDAQIEGPLKSGWKMNVTRGNILLLAEMKQRKRGRKNCVLRGRPMKNAKRSWKKRGLKKGLKRLTSNIIQEITHVLLVVTRPSDTTQAAAQHVGPMSLRVTGKGSGRLIKKRLREERRQLGEEKNKKNENRPRQ